METPEPKEGQTWTLDGDTEVTITSLAVFMGSGKIHRLEFRRPDGVEKSFTLREFLSRAVYKSG
jgi:hypothetical protein